MVAYTGGTSSVTVSAARDCEWTARSDAAWVTANPTNGAGDATIRVTVATNQQYSTRTARLLINDSGLEFIQQAAPPPPPPPEASAPQPGPSPSPSPTSPTSPPPTPPAPQPAPQTCTFELSRTSDTFEARGGEGDVGVRARVGCAWEARSNADWISIVRGSSGSGDGEVRFRVGDHSSTEERSGTISIAGRGFSIRQRGAEPPPRPGRVEVEGRVTSVSGSCPSLTLAVRGEPVTTDSTTRFRGSCRDIRVGVRVEVRGQRIGAGPIRAEEVRVEEDDDN